METSVCWIIVTPVTCANLLSFILYGYDKFSAKVHTGRIRENYLLLAAILAPFGGLAAMLVFRHKTRHAKFLLIPLFAALQFLIFLWFSRFAG